MSLSTNNSSSHVQSKNSSRESCDLPLVACLLEKDFLLSEWCVCACWGEVASNTKQISKTLCTNKMGKQEEVERRG